MQIIKLYPHDNTARNTQIIKLFLRCNLNRPKRTHGIVTHCYLRGVATRNIHASHYDCVFPFFRGDRVSRVDAVGVRVAAAERVFAELVLR